MIIAPECDGLRRQIEDCIASAYTKGYKRGQADMMAIKHTPCNWCAYKPPTRLKPCCYCPAKAMMEDTECEK